MRNLIFNFAISKKQTVMENILSYLMSSNNEQPTIYTTELSVDNLISKHEKCLELLNGIKKFKDRRESCLNAINGFVGTFPELRKKYINNVETINRCIERLENSYMEILLGK